VFVQRMNLRNLLSALRLLRALQPRPNENLKPKMDVAWDSALEKRHNSIVQHPK